MTGIILCINPWNNASKTLPCEKLITLPLCWASSLIATKSAQNDNYVPAKNVSAFFPSSLRESSWTLQHGGPLASLWSTLTMCEPLSVYSCSPRPVAHTLRPLSARRDIDRIFRLSKVVTECNARRRDSPTNVEQVESMLNSLCFSFETSFCIWRQSQTIWILHLLWCRQPPSRIAWRLCCSF